MDAGKSLTILTFESMGQGYLYLNELTSGETQVTFDLISGQAGKTILLISHDENINLPSKQNCKRSFTISKLPIELVKSYLGTASAESVQQMYIFESAYPDQLFKAGKLLIDNFKMLPIDLRIRRGGDLGGFIILTTTELMADSIELESFQLEGSLTILNKVSQAISELYVAEI